MLKIIPIRDDLGAVQLCLCGEMTKEYLPELDRMLASPAADAEKTSLDLANVTFVDRESMVFLCSAKTKNVLVQNCPSYVTRWMRQEKLCGPSEEAPSDDSCQT